jgi:arylsulfatase A-like enzyme
VLNIVKIAKKKGLDKIKIIVLLIVIFSLAVVLFNLKPANSAALERRICGDCNIILISIDTLRQDHLGVYGYGKNTSPNIDVFAKNALVFDNFYSTTSWTLPAHASLFTSRYPSEIVMQTPLDRLPGNSLTLAEVLKSNGYVTHAIAHNTFVSENWGFDQGFQDFQTTSLEKWGADSSRIFGEGQNWLKANKDKKFLLFLHTYEVHSPYCPPPDFDKFKGDYNGDTNCIDASDVGTRKMLQAEPDRYLSLYDGEILYTDYNFGKFAQTVKELGLDKNTIIIILSDHGEEFGENGQWGKHAHTLYQELVKVPLIIKSPVMPAGRSEKNISMVDIAPFILDTLDIKKPTEFLGVSIYDNANARPLYFELHIREERLFNDEEPTAEAFSKLITEERKELLPNTKQAVVYNGWKLIRNLDLKPSEYELYNLIDDPSEQNNVFNENTDKSKELAEMINKFNASVNRIEIPEEKAAIPARSEKELREINNSIRTLGY